MRTQHYLSFHDNISWQTVDMRRQGFGQWMNSSIVHDIICKFIHKKCHLKSYHSDIKYHMTLNIKFSVVFFGSIRAKISWLGIKPPTTPFNYGPLSSGSLASYQTSVEWLLTSTYLTWPWAYREFDNYGPICEPMNAQEAKIWLWAFFQRYISQD